MSEISPRVSVSVLSSGPTTGPTTTEALNSPGIGVVIGHPLKPETQPITSTESMREMLQGYGIIFYPRVRGVEIPIINAVKISRLVGEANIPPLQRAVAQIIEYLGTPAVGDSWGANHAGRREWRQQMMIRYGDSFKAVYDDNQLRVNVITPVYEALLKLNQIVPKHGQAEFFAALNAAQEHLKPVTGESEDQNGKLIKGEAYNNMGAEAKIKFVQKLEDHALLVLSTLSKGHTSKKPQRMLIT